MNISKKSVRLRRSKKTRSKMNQLKVDRIVVHRTPRHLYAQVIDAMGNVKCSVSTLDKDIKANFPNGGNVKVAEAVGKLLGEKIKEAKIEKLAFDRSGFQYHGRIKALADATRATGANF